MNKVTDFLEKNVEWLALGLGGIFLLWMVWAYVINPPVTVRIGGEELSLGEVDTRILRTKAQELKARIDDPTPVDLRFENVAGAFAQGLANKGMQPPPPLRPTTIVLGGGRQINIEDPREKIQKQAVVNALPDLPKPVPAMKESEGGSKPVQQISKGVSQVLMSPEVAALEQGGAVPPAPGAPGAPVMNVNEQAGNGVQRDKLWVTLKYLIPMKPLHDDLVQKNYYQALNEQVLTAFAQVEVEREELIGNNQWGNLKKIEPLPMNAAATPAVPNGQDPQVAQQYIEWVADNTLFILKPPFYPTVAGTTWTEPGWEPPPPPPEIPPTPEEIRAMREQAEEERLRKAAEARQRAAERRGGSGEEERRRPPSRRERDNTVRDGDRPGSALQGRLPNPQVPPEGYRRRPTGPGGAPPGSMFDEQFMDPGMAARPDQPVQPGEAVIPQEVTGRFVPAATTPDVDFWFHDATVEADKTYRYRVRYKMLNPIYNTFNVANPAALQQVLLLESPWSEWSEPVPMDALSQYFVSGGPREDSATFEVYKWEHGATNAARFDNVRPGDVVGGKRRLPDGHEVDFTTGVTVVDIRQSGPRGERVVVLMDSQGNLITRDYRTDQADATRKELQRKSEEDRVRMQRPGEGPAAGVRP